MKIYLLQRKDKDGFTETIWAWQPCKGWRIVAVHKCDCVEGHIVVR